MVPFIGVFVLTPHGAGHNWHIFGQSGWRLIYIVLCTCSTVNFALNMMNSSFKMMDFALNMMNFSFKMMDFVLK